LHITDLPFTDKHTRKRGSMTKFINSIAFVADIAVSKKFYHRILGLQIIEEHDNFIRFESGFAIHEAKSLEKTIWGTSSAGCNPLGRRNMLFYFEHHDIDAFYDNILANIDLVHPITIQQWGQRVFRFYDPDQHAIEVGEPIGK